MAQAQYTLSDTPYFATMTVEGFTDFFTRNEYRHALIDCLDFCQRQKGLEIHSYVLMTNHIHLIALARGNSLDKILAHFKSYSAKEMLRLCAGNPQESRKEWLVDRFRYFAHCNRRDGDAQFWTQGNYPVPIESDWFYEQKENYIHLNPVRAGFVASPSDWLFSSACP